MHRIALMAAAAASLWAGVASAQDITPNVQDFTGRTSVSLSDLSSTSRQPINLSECDATITFRFTNVDTTRSELHFYQGASCDDPEVRNSTTTMQCTDLELTDSIDMLSQQDVAVRVDQLLPMECADQTGSGTANIWVLALSNDTDAVTGTGQKTTFPIAFDFNAPSAPSVTANPGEAAAQLTWPAQEGIASYEIFLDPTGCSDAGEVISPGLTSDPPDETLIVSTTAGSATAGTAPYPSTVGTGGLVAVAVRAVDDGGNVSPLSTPVCVERIEVVSWWDAECGTGAHEWCGGGCAVTGRDAGGGAWLSLAALALGVVALRRRSAR